MRVALFYHSLISDWNHGNAHFLRGVASEMQARGCEVRIFEPEDGWSYENLLRERGPSAVAAFEQAFPHLTSTRYRRDQLFLDEWLEGVDLVIAHEWNDPKLISAVGEYRRTHSAVRVLFHDTHHRALTAEHELAQFDLSNYDGVLVYGASLKEAYERRGWGTQVYVWHEAADVRVFYPRANQPRANQPRAIQKAEGDVVWIGNWGDDERTEELREYFLDPVENLSLRAKVYGVRYPDAALRELRERGILYGGWLPNFEVPVVFARFKATVHVPRRPYTRELPGIPTIRPFEALACAIPLVSAPWQDSEGLFRVGEDFLMARNGSEMRDYLRDVLHDEKLAENLRQKGLETILNRHTCGHRVQELLQIYAGIRTTQIPADRALAEARS